MFVKVDLRTVTCNIPPQEVILVKDMLLEIRPTSFPLHGQLKFYSMFVNSKGEDELNFHRTLLQEAYVASQTTGLCFVK